MPDLMASGRLTVECKAESLEAHGDLSVRKTRKAPHIMRLQLMDNPALIDHHDLVRVLDGCQPVRDDNDGFVVGQGAEGGLYQLFVSQINDQNLFSAVHKDPVPFFLQLARKWFWLFYTFWYCIRRYSRCIWKRDRRRKGWIGFLR
jgi:hypothetical protein